MISFQKLQSKRIIVIASVVLSLFAIFTLQGISSAVTVLWPDYNYRLRDPYNDWPLTADPQPPAQTPAAEGLTANQQVGIAIESEKRQSGGVDIITHEVPEAFIGIYRTGNTTGQPVQFQLVSLNCRLDDLAGNPTARFMYTTSSLVQYPTTWPNGLLRKGPNPPSSTNITATACPDVKTITINLPAAAAVYDVGINMTRYTFHVYMDNLVVGFPPTNNTAIKQGVHFRLFSDTNVGDTANNFGILGGHVVPFTHHTQDRYYVHYRIPLGPSCSTVGNVPGTITVKDSDNFYQSGNYPGGNLNGAQAVNGKNQAMEVALSELGLPPGYIAATMLTPNVDVTDPQFGNRHGWRDTTPAGNIYMPSNLGSNQDNSLRYSFVANKNYMFNILNGGDGNFLAVDIPFDEIYGKVACVAPPVEATAQITLIGPDDYEIGAGTAATYSAQLTITQDYCDLSAASKNYPVNFASLFGAPVVPLPASVSVVFGSCTNLVTINGTTYSTAVLPVTVPLGNITISAAQIAGFGEGGQFGVRASSTLGATVNKTTTVFSAPYLRVYGNDLSAAGCFDPRGSIVDGRPNAGNLYGGITASRRTMEVAYPATSAAPDPRTVYTAAGGNVYAGAAAEYAAIALTTRSNTILNGSFQNHPSSPIRLQAFWSAGNRTCPDTVYSKISGVESLPGIVDATIVAGGTISNMGSLAAGNNYYARASGNVTIDNPGASVSTSGKYTIYANGDVRITDNIIATKPAPFSNTTATVTLIIASGSIYIDPGVTQVDAVLVAQNDIYSCGSGGFGGQAQNTVHTNCRSKLTINGALNARYIHLQRSIGTRLLALNNEQSTAVGGNAAAAEAINYPYYLYFTTPYLADKAESTFQSYFSPAPYF